MVYYKLKKQHLPYAGAISNYGFKRVQETIHISVHRGTVYAVSHKATLCPWMSDISLGRGEKVGIRKQ